MESEAQVHEIECACSFNLSAVQAKAQRRPAPEHDFTFQRRTLRRRNAMKAHKGRFALLAGESKRIEIAARQLDRCLMETHRPTKALQDALLRFHYQHAARLASRLAAARDHKLGFATATALRLRRQWVRKRGTDFSRGLMERERRCRAAYGPLILSTFPYAQQRLSANLKRKWRLAAIRRRPCQFQARGVLHPDPCVLARPDGLGLSAGQWQPLRACNGRLQRLRLDRARCWSSRRVWSRLGLLKASKPHFAHFCPRA